MLQTVIMLEKYDDQTICFLLLGQHKYHGTEHIVSLLCNPCKHFSGQIRFYFVCFIICNTETLVKIVLSLLLSSHLSIWNITGV